MRQVFRFIVMVDDREYRVNLTGDPLAVQGGPDYVEFWAEHDSEKTAVTRTFRAFGTGHKLPDGFVYVGTAPRTAMGLVWHLYEYKEE